MANKNMKRCSPLVVVAVALILAEVVGAGRRRRHWDVESDWNSAIQHLLDQHAAAFNAHDVDGLVAGYSSETHSLQPGKPTMIGAEAIKAAFQKESWPPTLELKLSYLRFYCDYHAVAEYSSHLPSGSEHAKGVILVKLDDGIPKVTTWIYNMS